MKRINLYALIIVTIVLILFCLAIANVNAQEADKDGRPVTHLGEFIDALFSRVDELDERITGIEDADRQDKLWNTTDDLGLFVGDLERELFSFGDMPDRLDGCRGIRQMPRSGARPAAAITEERYIRREAADLRVFRLQAVDNRPTQIPS